MREFSPVCRVIAGKKYPPFLLLLGSGDTLVPYSQMETLYEALQTADTEVKAVCVDGGEHEGNFWGPEVRAMIHWEPSQWSEIPFTKRALSDKIITGIYVFMLFWTGGCRR